MSQGVCVVVGVGPGIGAAVAARFASGGHEVALCSRDEKKLNEIAAGIGGARVFACDVRDPGDVESAFRRIRKEMGPVKVMVYNAGAGAFANIDDATVADLQSAWEVNCRGLFLAVKAVLPDMRATGSGNILITGATASIKGGANFLPFASAKAAQRSLAQSLARHLGPQRIHVSYVIVDGIVDLETTRRRMPGKPDEFFMDPAQIAESMFFLTQQPAQAWTFELDLRPFAEKW